MPNPFNMKNFFSNENADNSDLDNPNEVSNPFKTDDKKNEKTPNPFSVGDVLILSNTKKSSKIPDDAWDFLMTFKTFTVVNVKENGKLDLGCIVSKNAPEGGKEVTFLFSPSRFSLKEPSKENKLLTPFDFDDDN